MIETGGCGPTVNPVKIQQSQLEHPNICSKPEKNMETSITASETSGQEQTSSSPAIKSQRLAPKPGEAE